MLAHSAAIAVLHAWPVVLLFCIAELQLLLHEIMAISFSLVFMGENPFFWFWNVSFGALLSLES